MSICVLVVNTCSCRSVTGCRESIPLSNHDGSNAQDTHNGEVDKSRLRGAVEGVVQPRHKGAHDQKSNAWVVQSEMKDYPLSFKYVQFRQANNSW